MWGRDKNFQVSMLYELSKFHLLSFLLLTFYLKNSWQSSLLILLPYDQALFILGRELTESSLWSNIWDGVWWPTPNSLNVKYSWKYYLNILHLQIKYSNISCFTKFANQILGNIKIMNWIFKYISLVKTQYLYWNIGFSENII